MAVPEPFTGVTSSSPVRHHILSVLVENKAGVLARIAGLFARRGFNIYSLAVAPADDSQRFSRITIVVDAESAPLEQIRGQLDKLINVVEIKDLAPREALERELLLATVEVDDETRQAVLDAVAQANAAIVDVNDTSVTLMLAGTPAACDALERQLEAFAQIELHRTGRVALPRLSSEPTRN
ncbi:MAG: acetolactate synthase small subunit [Actinomycetes bacterium]|jgi:acetolactate synthase-1/3 small subunit